MLMLQRLVDEKDSSCSRANDIKHGSSPVLRRHGHIWEEMLRDWLLRRILLVLWPNIKQCSEDMDIFGRRGVTLFNIASCTIETNSRSCLENGLLARH